MFPMRLLTDEIGELLAASEPLLQAVNENIVRLIIAPFALEQGLEPGDLTFADFDGSTALEVVAAADMAVGFDPLTGEQVITINEPAGGWRWEVTGLTNLPQTVYGFALLTAASAAVIGVQALDTPIPLTEVGQEINLGSITFRVNVVPLS